MWGYNANEVSVLLSFLFLLHILLFCFCSFSSSSVWICYWVEQMSVKTISSRASSCIKQRFHLPTSFIFLVLFTWIRMSRRFFCHSITGLKKHIICNPKWLLTVKSVIMSHLSVRCRSANTHTHTIGFFLTCALCMINVPFWACENVCIVAFPTRSQAPRAHLTAAWSITKEALLVEDSARVKNK